MSSIKRVHSWKPLLFHSFINACNFCSNKQNMHIFCNEKINWIAQRIEKEKKRNWNGIYMFLSSSRSAFSLFIFQLVIEIKKADCISVYSSINNKNKNKKTTSIIMGDEMDECACFWSHEFAMRRLLALVRFKNGYFCLCWFHLQNVHNNPRNSFVDSWDKDRLTVQIPNALIVSNFCFVLSKFNREYERQIILFPKLF